MLILLMYALFQRFGAAFELSSKESLDKFETILKRLGSKNNDTESKEELRPKDLTILKRLHFSTESQ